MTDCWITSALLPCLIDGMNGQREGEETTPVHSFHSNEWTKLRDVRIVEDPDEWVGGYRPAVVYIYVSDPERCCIDFGDSEFEGLDLTYKLVDDKVRECICH